MSSVIDFPEPDEQQLVLEGFPEPSGRYFGLTSARNLPTNQDLSWEQHVSGTLEGVLSGVRLARKGGELVKVWEITVIEAELDG